LVSEKTKKYFENLYWFKNFLLLIF
jgi:hypothetical protein